MSRKKVFYLALVSLALLALAGYRVVPMVKVTNRCGQDIDYLTVEISGKTLQFGAIPMGDTGKKSLRITRDSRFMVTYKLADGTNLRLPVGHIDAPAWWSRTQITIHSGGALDIRYD